MGALAVAVVVSLSAFLLILIRDWSVSSGFKLAQVQWHRLLTCFFISSGLLLCYRSYALKQCWRLKLLYFFGIPLLSVFLRSVVSQGGRFQSEEIVAWLSRLLPSLEHYSMLGLLPFLLPLGIVAWLSGFFRENASRDDGAFTWRATGLDWAFLGLLILLTLCCSFFWFNVFSPIETAMQTDCVDGAGKALYNVRRVLDNRDASQLCHVFCRNS